MLTVLVRKGFGGSRSDLNFVGRMRFLAHEHAAITDALREHRIDPATVLFVKRRGWLHIELKEHVRSFAFHRKKRTILHEQGRWQEKVEYMINAHGQTKEGLALGDMITELQLWLKDHPR